jgi:ABC-type multidrug transport system ATPase subunit
MTKGRRMRHAILAEGIRKKYGNTTALDGVDLTLPPGQLLALLGPNGAGKTTAVNILTTLLRPDSGTARILGPASTSRSTTSSRAPRTC